MKPPESVAPIPNPEPALGLLGGGALLAAELVNSELGTDRAPIHDCWNLIGVEGNRTCRELLKFTHCRNCPVYSAAAIQLLDRPLPADYRRAGARHYAQQKKNTPATRLSAVLFRLSNEWLALPTAVFQEVAERRTTHSLPHRRGGIVLGLVNVRGELLICVSAARLLRIPSSEFRVPGSPVPNNPELETRNPGRCATARLLVTTWNGLRLAFPVDEVHGIHRLPQDELKTRPATISNSEPFLGYTQGVFGWRDRTVGLLDADSFFNSLNHRLA